VTLHDDPARARASGAAADARSDSQGDEADPAARAASRATAAAGDAPAGPVLAPDGAGQIAEDADATASILPAPSGWSDPLTRTDGPDLWHRLMASERARVERYKRPVTIAFVEVAGLDRLARQWGVDVAQRALVRVARVLVRNARTSDYVARINRARFGVLLTETAEIPAINFVERARSACEREIGRGALEFIKIGFGWASPPKGDLDEAVELALRRLAADVGEDPRSR
jgi:diguanylate cyclase (GGDEF)-like protein